MKKSLLLISLLTTGLSIGQTTDTVSLGSGYTNQCWYSLENGDQVNETKSDWDIAFETSPYGYSILINHSVGIRLWEAPTDTSNWLTLDTVGMGSWTERYNADTSWSYGAFSQIQTGMLVGWGTYNTITHHINGDKLFVLKLADGSYKKIWIKFLANATYSFEYANLDNSGNSNVDIVKGNYFGKNFAYYSLVSDSELDKEPNSDSWDLLFGQYAAADAGYYLVSGVLSNIGTKVAQAYPVNDPATYVDFSSETFESNINTIGYDWKSFNMGTFQYDIQDSLVYFIETQNGDLWKLEFTGFDGSSTGNFIFNKQFLGSVDLSENTIEILNVYPNPASEFLHFTIDQKENSTVSLVDLTGKTVSKQNISSGLNTHSIDVSSIPSGLYLLIITGKDGSKAVKKVQIS